MDTNGKAMSRRQFALGAATAAAAFGLAACGPQPTSGASSSAAGNAQQAENAGKMLPGVWDYDADVVIVGGGGAGYMAAAAAHEAGATSIIVEKMDATGGDTAISSCFTIGCWPAKTQEDSGASDDPDTYIQDQLASHDFSHKGMRGEGLGDTTIFERQVRLEADTFQWLTDVAGVEWQSYYYSNACTTPQPGWDTVSPRDWAATSGIYLPLRTLTDGYEDTEVLTGIEVLDIVKDEGGRAVGVRGAHTETGSEVYVHAKRGVIIATGNINANHEMMVKYLGHTVADLPDGGSTGITGDGHRMAVRAGGSLRDMDLGTHWMPLLLGSNSQEYMMSMLGAGPLAGAYMPGILVNYDGVRYTNENLGYSLSGKNTAEQKYSIGWYVIDSQAAAILTDDPSDVIMAQADTIEDLAQRMGVNKEAFVAEVAKYNGYVDAGKDPDFDKALDGCPKIEKAPFYALPIQPHPYCTYGGIVVDADCHVLDAQNEPIPSLFAAGMCTGSFAEQAGIFYTGGISQTVVFGRLAGQLAAATEPVA